MAALSEELAVQSSSEHDQAQELARRMEELALKVNPELIAAFANVFEVPPEQAHLLLGLSSAFKNIRGKTPQWLEEQARDKKWRKSQEQNIGKATEQVAQIAAETEQEMATEKKAVEFQRTFRVSEDEAYFMMTLDDYSWLLDDSIFDDDNTFKDALAGEAASFNIKQLQSRYAQFLKLGGGSGGSSGDWATVGVRSAAKQIALRYCELEIFPNGSYTIHHKVSRSHLKRVAAALEEAGEEADGFRKVLGSVGQRLLNSSDNFKKILLNLPFNLEVGPLADKRDADPGSGFDGTPGTPRSRKLAEFDALTENIDSYWDRAARILDETCDIHIQMLKKSAGPLTEPVTTQWVKKGARFVRE